MPSAADWDERYRTGDTPWDLTGPTPELLRLKEEGLLPAKGRALVPGGGLGHDAFLLAEHGLGTDLVDISPTALLRAQVTAFERKITNLAAYRRDFFSLLDTSYHQQSYDLIWEYTFYCAIEPGERAAYARTVAGLLKPGGLLAALFFPLASDKPGPPYPVSRAEIEELFGPFFRMDFSEPKRSVKPREGREVLGLFTRK